MASGPSPPNIPQWEPPRTTLGAPLHDEPFRELSGENRFLFRLVVEEGPAAGGLGACGEPCSPTPRRGRPPRGEKAKAPAPSPAADCTTDLNTLWEKGEHDIRGTTYWLSQVFTIDLDGDRRTDNVGFRLTAANTPELVIRYYAGPGNLAGRSVPTLRLDHEDMISRLCFGQVSFPTPRRQARETPRGFEIPDLEKEMMSIGKPAPAVTPAERGGVVLGGLWAAMAAGSGLVVAAGGAGVYLTRRKWLPALNRLGKARRKDGGEEEDEEEEEEEKDEDAKDKK